MIKKIVFLCFFGFISFSGFAQWDFSGSVHLNGYIYDGEQQRLPFWMYHNQRGRVSAETNVSGWVSAKTQHEFRNGNTVEIGGGVLFKDGREDRVFIDELYASYNNSWLEATVGRKQKKERYRGLSSTNESMLWSLNSRPMPGLQLATNRTIFFSPTSAFGFEAAWEEYLMGEDRFVKNARLHHKYIKLVYNPNPGFLIQAGIRHFAQWGGDSPETGKQPSGFKDYLRVITGREGGSNAVAGDQNNVLGNQLGAYELEIRKRINNDLELSFIYNHMFEDGTGSRFANFPDGRYGIFIDFLDDKKLINGIMYEFFYTRDQSINSSAPHKNDNYFNNFVTYHSGFTYQRRIIGLPFFTYDEGLDEVVNNKFSAHHLGFSGNLSNYFNSYPWKLLMSFSHNEGRNYQHYIPNRDVGSGMFEITLLQNFVRLDLNLGLEISNVAEPLYGAGVHLSKRF